MNLLNKLFVSYASAQCEQKQWYTYVDNENILHLMDDFGWNYHEIDSIARTIDKKDKINRFDFY